MDPVISHRRADRNAVSEYNIFILDAPVATGNTTPKTTYRRPLPRPTFLGPLWRTALARFGVDWFLRPIPIAGERLTRNFPLLVLPTFGQSTMTTPTVWRCCCRPQVLISRKTIHIFRVGTHNMNNEFLEIEDGRRRRLSVPISTFSSSLPLAKSWSAVGGSAEVVRLPKIHSYIACGQRTYLKQRATVERIRIIHHRPYTPLACYFSSWTLDEAQQQRRSNLFDPQVYPSSAYLMNMDPNEKDELSPEEQQLQVALEDYRREVDKHISDNNNADGDDGTSFSDLAPFLERLQQAYMDLLYWGEALHVEQCKCRLWYKEGTDEYADSIHAQGKLFLRQENFAEAKRLYDLALDYFSSQTMTEATPQRQQQRGHVLISLAGWHFFRQDLERAMTMLDEAEPLLDANPALLVKCLDNQGLVHRMWGDFDAALDKYRQALQVVAGVDLETERALQLHVADMLVALEEPDEALEIYKGLLARLEEENHKKGKEDRDQQRGDDMGMKGVLWHNIASIHMEQGEYDLALEEFRMALELKRASAGGEYNPEVARTLNSLGALHAGIFDDKLEALECFQQALIIARIHAESDPQSDPDVLSALQNIAMMEQQLQEERK